MPSQPRSAILSTKATRAGVSMKMVPLHLVGELLGDELTDLLSERFLFRTPVELHGLSPFSGCRRPQRRQRLDFALVVAELPQHRVRVRADVRGGGSDRARRLRHLEEHPDLGLAVGAQILRIDDRSPLAEVRVAATSSRE